MNNLLSDLLKQLGFNSITHFNDDNYLIPRNISQRFEFMPGYGWKEIFIILSGLSLGLLLFLVLRIFHVSAFPRVLIIILFTGAGILATSPVMPDGSTALDMLRYSIRFKKTQKLYLYTKRGL